MSQQLQHPDPSGIDLTDYPGDTDGFREFLHDLADAVFPFPGYRENQDEILYETLEAFFIEGYRNVVIEGPTGIGKSPFNVAMGRAVSVLNRIQRDIEDHFGVFIDGLVSGNAFYTTPQKSLRNQLAEDDDPQVQGDWMLTKDDGILYALYQAGVIGEQAYERAPDRTSA